MTRGATWAVVPVKELETAKQRLTGALDLAARRGLLLAMLADVLDALAGVPALDGVALISRDAHITELARDRNCRPLQETGVGLNAAVTEAARVLTAEGCAAMLVVPVDVPLVSPAEIARILETQGSAPALTLVPDRHRAGTNALACSPPGVITPRFGAESFARHLAVARDAGIDATVLRLPGLGLDIDTPDDLDAFAGRPGSTRTHAFLHVERSMPPLAAGARR